MNTGFWSAPDTTPAAPRAAGWPTAAHVALADELDENRDENPSKLVGWRGASADAGGALSDLAAVACVLAARGLKATITVEPSADGEVGAFVRIA